MVADVRMCRWGVGVRGNSSFDQMKPQACSEKLIQFLIWTIRLGKPITTCSLVELLFELKLSKFIQIFQFTHFREQASDIRATGCWVHSLFIWSSSISIINPHQTIDFTALSRHCLSSSTCRFLHTLLLSDGCTSVSPVYLSTSSSSPRCCEEIKQ